MVNTRDAHEFLNGQRIKPGETFSVDGAHDVLSRSRKRGMRTGGGYEIAYPGDPNAPARAVINCRCVLIPRVMMPGTTAENGLTDEDGYGIIVSDGDENWHPITSESISSAPKFVEFDTPELNDAVEKACKDILTNLKDDEIGTEGTVSIQLSDIASKYRKGGSGEGIVRILQMDSPFIAIHNHPSNETFSYLDIDHFVELDQCRGMVVVGNNGKSVYLLLKTGKYDYYEAKKYILAQKYKFKVFDSEEDFLAGVDSRGIRYVKRDS